jgi:alkanesulfonate monooxygenase
MTIIDPVHCKLDPQATSLGHSKLEIFATCPQSKDFISNNYRQRVIDVARWSEQSGCTGVLIYTDNSIVDAWLVAQIIIQNTQQLCPLVAVQPVYMHPYTVAKMVASFGFLHNRRIYLNMVAGGFRGDLKALDDPTEHDDRYARLIEYTQIIKLLLQHPDPVSFGGKYHKIRELRMTPPLPPELMPGIFMSGSSEAGIAAARETGATAVVYPRPREDEMAADQSLVAVGARVGIIARPTTEEAWQIAHTRFPNDPKGRLTHKLAMRVSDSVWHRQLSEVIQNDGSPYWLWPFQTYQTFCPYVVGSFAETAEFIARYIAMGFHKFILDIPQSPDDLEGARITFENALARSSK